MTCHRNKCNIFESLRQELRKSKQLLDENSALKQKTEVFNRKPTTLKQDLSAQIYIVQTRKLSERLKAKL